MFRNKSILTVATLAGSVLLADAAFAEEHNLHATALEVANACSKTGGSLDGNPDGYSCVKKNCDGKGGECGIYCTRQGNCVGHTPGIRAGNSKTFSTETT